MDPKLEKKLKPFKKFSKDELKTMIYLSIVMLERKGHDVNFELRDIIHNFDTFKVQ